MVFEGSKFWATKEKVLMELLLTPGLTMHKFATCMFKKKKKKKKDFSSLYFSPEFLLSIIYAYLLIPVAPNANRSFLIIPNSK